MAPKRSLLAEVNQQGAHALLTAAYEFLRSNQIADRSIVDFVRTYSKRRSPHMNSKAYTELLRAYEGMGLIMATWFSDPRFLDRSGNPRPLSTGKGANSLSRLIRVSRAAVDASVVLKLMKRSPSIKFDDDGNLAAIRRVFVLPEMEVPRAAFVIERYLDTLQQNAVSRRRATTLLLERSCHVSAVDLAAISPLLRNIEGQGTAFMDSIDGEIEGKRLRRSRRKTAGEIGVLVFAWARSAPRAVAPAKPRPKRVTPEAAAD